MVTDDPGIVSESMSSEQERLLDPDELAEALGISKKTVYRMAREGDIPHYRFRGQLRFKLGEVLEATRNRPSEGGPE